MVNRTSLYPVYEQDIQDVQDVQDEEACGSQSVSLVMKPLILAILSVLAILLRFLDSIKKVEIVNDNFGYTQWEYVMTCFHLSERIATDRESKK